MSLNAMALLIIVLHLASAAILFPALKLLSLFIKRRYAELSWLWLTAIILTFCVPAYALISQLTPMQSAEVQYSAPAIEVSETTVDTPVEATPDFVTDFLKMIHMALPGVIGLWALGVIWLIGRLLVAIRAERRIKRAATAAPKLGSLTKYTILTSDEIESPMLVGFFNPVILIPNNLIDIDQQALSSIIQHEEAHMERKDTLWSVFQTCISILYWWNPLIRMMNTELNFNRELDCDQRVMNKGANPQNYAKTLIECAQQLTQNHTQLNQQFLVKRKLFSARINEVITMRKVKSNKYLSIFLCGILCTSAFAVAEISEAGKGVSDLPSNQDVKPDPEYIPKLIRQMGQAVVQSGVKNRGILIVGPKTKIEGSIQDSNRAKELMKQYMVRLNQNHDGMEVLLNLLQKNKDGSSNFVLTLPTEKATDAFHSTELPEGLQINKISSTPQHISFEGTAPGNDEISLLFKQFKKISPETKVRMIQRNRPTEGGEGVNFKLTFEPSHPW